MKKKVAEHIALPQPIDLRYKYVKRLIGSRKRVHTSLSEQKKLKKAFIKIYPDNLFYDDLGDPNSICLHSKCDYSDDSWIAQRYLDELNNDQDNNCNHSHDDCDDSCACSCGDD